MSNDAGIYILESNDGYRVAYCQAINNLFWWPTCCDNPKIEYDCEESEKYLDFFEKCLNCGYENPAYEQRDKINPNELIKFFGESKVFKSKRNAMIEAQKIYKKILLSDFPILEYGIQLIKYDGDFPKGDK